MCMFLCVFTRELLYYLYFIYLFLLFVDKLHCILSVIIIHERVHTNIVVIDYVFSGYIKLEVMMYYFKLREIYGCLINV